MLNKTFYSYLYKLNDRERIDIFRNACIGISERYHFVFDALETGRDHVHIFVRAEPSINIQTYANYRKDNSKTDNQNYTDWVHREFTTEEITKITIPISLAGRLWRGQI